MPTAPDPFDEFLREIDPLMQLQQSYSKRSVVLMGKLDIACIAVKCGKTWANVSGKAVLRAYAGESGTQFARIAQLPEIVAFEGHMPAKEVNSLIADLKDSWVLRCENVRLTTGGRNYNWRLPYLIKAPDPGWQREFALHGYGPDLSSLLSGSSLQKIDTDLRHCTSFDGFDGLCARLHLPHRRDNLTSSFQLSAELPALVFSAQLRLTDWSFDVMIHDFGVPPHVTVEWLPQHEMQQISRDRISWADDPDVPRIVSIPISYDAQKAKVTLWRGELRADVVTVNLGLGNDEPSDFEPLEFEREEPTAPDFATKEVCQQEIVRQTPLKLPRYRSKLKRGILLYLMTHGPSTDEEVCFGLDVGELVEPTSSFNKNRDPQFFEHIYKDERRKHSIEVQIDKVRTDMRKVGIKV